ncbi:50S ribosomal protein L18 [Candidatus Vidania fulgoroideorum]
MKYITKNRFKNLIIINKTIENFHTQVISYKKKQIMLSCSTSEKYLRRILKRRRNKFCNFYSYYLIGKILALRLLYSDVTNIALKRMGFKFHGKLKVFYESLKNFYNLINEIKQHYLIN